MGKVGAVGGGVVGVHKFSMRTCGRTSGMYDLHMVGERAWRPWRPRLSHAVSRPRCSQDSGIACGDGVVHAPVPTPSYAVQQGCCGPDGGACPVARATVSRPSFNLPDSPTNTR